MQEMVSCWVAVAVSNRPNLLKNVYLKKRSVYERKPNCTHLALYAKPSYAKPVKPKPPLA
ncbi:hypothetical protein BRDID11004_59920 [Bradyrhizobium diazoefficiens]|uniref:Uncharacterized protein n=1 Tax=Bradyrhizobium diazoefficiens TaxID=1355477 RepID=A0A810AHM0_9BRAD|nr:hypothetical protein F07S3_29420 [Bradyrhizobium diazoefficiens]BCE55195.1 hypothetical protein XF5B_27070 [Bradyrhizobium diazoefficiens]BCE63929.1 hypothetical protein XF6B_27280 [Bradyrhizobium diazoefficiens]